ncbi:MAG: hypothetical protein RR891_12450 [Clostridium sp.]
MEYKKITIIALMIIIVGSWTFNVYKFAKTSLKEPIFLNHYIDSDEKIVDIYYIDNVFSNEKYNLFTAPNIKGKGSLVSEKEKKVKWERYQWPYKINKLTVDFSDVVASTGQEVNTLLEKGQVHISKICIAPNKGSAFNVEVGDIYLRKSDIGKSSFCESLGGDSFSTSTGSETYIANRDIEITGVKGGFLDYINENYHIIINNKSIENEDTFPIKIGTGKKIEIYYISKFSGENKKLDNVNKLRLALNIIDKDNNEDHINFQIGNGEPWISNEFEMKKVVEELKNSN